MYVAVATAAKHEREDCRKPRTQTTTQRADKQPKLPQMLSLYANSRWRWGKGSAREKRKFVGSMSADFPRDFDLPVLTCQR